jgi:hypothetical protein
MLTIGRNVLSDPSKIIQSARFVQEEVRSNVEVTAQHSTPAAIASTNTCSVQVPDLDGMAGHE